MDANEKHACFTRVFRVDPRLRLFLHLQQPGIARVDRMGRVARHTFLQGVAVEVLW